MWYVTGAVGGLIGAIWGWYDPSGFFGDFPPGLSSGLGALGGALASGWAFQRDAERKSLSPLTLLVSGLLAALVVTTIMIAAGCSITESTFGTYLGYVGGIAIVTNPTGAMVGMVFGMFVWFVDWIEWTASADDPPAPEGLVSIFSGGVPRFLIIVFFCSIIGAAVGGKSKK